MSGRRFQTGNTFPNHKFRVAPALPKAKRLHGNTIIRFWANTSYSGGTPSLDDNVNCAGIADTDTGKITFTIGTDMSNATYSMSGTGTGAIHTVTGSSFAAGSFIGTIVQVSDGAAADGDASFMVVGDN